MSKSRERHDKDMTTMSKEAFKGHRIITHTEGRWLIARPGKYPGEYDWCFATEVIADLWGKGMYVGGDTKPVIFSGGPAHPEAKVRWMGGRKSGGDQYLVEKATTGTGKEVIEMFDADVARDDMTVLQHEIAEESEGDPAIEAIEDIKRCCDEMGRDEVIRDLMEAYSDSERVYDIGVVVSPRVYYAHAALARLCELLDEKQKEETDGRDSAHRAG